VHRGVGRARSVRPGRGAEGGCSAAAAYGRHPDAAGGRVTARDRPGTAPSRAADDRDLRQGRSRHVTGARAPVARTGRCGMTSLRAALDDYLVIRHGLGFAMPQDGRLLAGFVEFLDRAGARENHHRACAAVGEDASRCGSEPLGPAAWRRAGIRPSPGDDRLDQRGPIHRPAARAPPADCPLHLLRGADRGVDGGRGPAGTVAAGDASPEPDRAVGCHRHAPCGGSWPGPPGRRLDARCRARACGQAEEAAGATPAREHDQRAWPVRPAARRRRPDHRRSSCPREDDGWAARNSTGRSPS